MPKAQVPPRQGDVLRVLIKEPGLTAEAIRERLGGEVSTHGVAHALIHLHKRKLIDRVGTHKRRRYYAMVDDFEVVHSKQSLAGAVAAAQSPYTGPDLLLDRIARLQLTPEQWAYLRAHRKRPRSVLADRLGISRIELCFALMILDEGGEKNHGY